MCRAFLLALILVPVVAAAQLEEVVVTVPEAAAFLVQSIRLVNDSSSPDLRRQEIVQTIESMTKQAALAQNLELSYGKGFLLPIDLSEDALEVIEDNKRSDTSYVDVYVKVKFNPTQDAESQISALRKFIAGASKVGRTEIDTSGDIGRSIILTTFQNATVR